ncbi:biliverdin-producing heme oxygenase [Frigidibacter mobilis]|uniref:Heme oxygenase family protein n=1 Tax=Frigidibacter mobilis TaxID=1335048 RepID=A0A165SIE6_9RHOB|nr:biliverdin-producing heme oxygenase [Frigidibacter mobilis]AMY68389.1 heme oxygenase family protein [Frigidibacter mobilis]
MSSVDDRAAVSRRLKAATSTTHDRLDARILRARPFDSLGNYATFLAVQYGFHSVVAPLYLRADLIALWPDLPRLARLEDVRADLADLGSALPVGRDRPDLSVVTRPAALGWLYVSEGSNLGAAVLSKAVLRLGLDGQRGARHLQEAAGGRMLRWRAFTSVLDALPLGDADEAAMQQGARDAFGWMQAAVEADMPLRS